MYQSTPSAGTSSGDRARRVRAVDEHGDAARGTAPAISATGRISALSDVM